ncbi:GOLPH3/VPS74 family protein [Kutzneria sp. CA-103260]|uniref:GOLPH3/VPS74 family protein n=1 Tax=Kutzneria sp. CA-103260 TaxID=2802641 RepID=UPI001BA93780|nr:GPP34 family phosphoprotein [Kutzneria sp. CA-103260]QUQ67068.1 Golgi phosphoprotein 3 (GPP34) [Kutzneria sp. CA-103260]
MVGALTLPEEFALLSLADTGKAIDYGQAMAGCALAELGELALRGKLLIRPHNFTVFGLKGSAPSAAKIELVDAAPVGLAWADELLAELVHTGETVAVSKLLRRRRRRDAFALHRDALVARGLVRQVPVRGLFRRERYYPDPTVRNGLIDEVRLATGGERRLDGHMLFLSDLVVRGDLHRGLRISLKRDPRRSDLIKSIRERNRARWMWVVESVPEPLRETSESLASLLWFLTRRSGDDGGD